MQTVVGIFGTRDEADCALERLNRRGVPPDQISVAMRQSDSSDPALAGGSDDLTGQGAAAGAISGAAVGTLVGLSLVGSNIVLPGVGMLLVGGPLAAALAGAGIGAASGGLLGALIGSGVPESEAKGYASDIEEGLILISANVSDAAAATVRQIFDEEGSRRTHSVAR
jgi:hypothetical protein